MKKVYVLLGACLMLCGVRNLYAEKNAVQYRGFFQMRFVTPMPQKAFAPPDLAMEPKSQVPLAATPSLDSSEPPFPPEIMSTLDVREVVARAPILHEN